MKPEVRWPLFIAGLLALQVVFGVIFFVVASSDRSFAVEENYYDKAVNWDAKRAQDRRNVELGWLCEPVVQRIAGDPSARNLLVALSAADGTPVSGAVVRAEVFANARARDILRARLDEVEPGLYRAQLGMRRPGQWEVRLTAELGAARFTHVSRLQVARPLPPSTNP